MSFKQWKNSTPKDDVKISHPSSEPKQLAPVSFLEGPKQERISLPLPSQSSGSPKIISPYSQQGIDILSSSRAVSGAKAIPSAPTNMSEVKPGYYSPAASQPVWKSLPRGMEPSRGPRVRFFDPLSLVYATGFRDRRYSLSYDVIRRTVKQLSILEAIILTRVNQVASFGQPYRENKQVGFQIRFKDENRIPTEDEKQAMKRIEQFFMECGWGPNPYSPYPRDRFLKFLKKITRDSLKYDQLTFEIVPDAEGRPYEFRAVDASTIRLAATYDGYRGEEPRTFQGKEFTDRWQQEYGEQFKLDGEKIFTVQVLQGRIENIFTQGDMAFAIRNDDADIWLNGYGASECEKALNTVTNMLYAETYNARNFSQGSMANGILNLKGELIDPAMVEDFKRNWAANVVGVESSHRIPLMQIPEGIEFVNIGKTNREMEYKGWLDYLIKILTGIYSIDPSEINFDLVGGSGGGKGPLFENKHEWKIKHSRDKGLRPLLRFLADTINEYIMDPLDSRFYFDFVGFDQLSQQDRIELAVKEVSNIKTFNEVRQDFGLDPVPGGDIINSQVFMQSNQTAMADESQQPVTSPLSPWRTAGDIPELEYGHAPPVPLYLQKGDDGLDEKEQEEGGPPGMPGGDMGGGDMGDMGGMM